MKTKNLSAHLAAIGFVSDQCASGKYDSFADVRFDTIVELANQNYGVVDHQGSSHQRHESYTRNCRNNR
jgi:hypothetical protein